MSEADRERSTVFKRAILVLYCRSFELTEVFVDFFLHLFRHTTMSHNIVLITGANRGLGRAISECLTRAVKPYTIVMISRSISAAEDAAREITALGLGDHDIVAQHFDMEDERSIHSLAETMNELYGRIDVLVNNAGESIFSTRSFYS